MSMIEKQVEELMCLKTSKLLRDNKSAQHIIGNAIDTIQVLSAKLSSSNLNGGWHIVADGDLPKDDESSEYYDTIIISLNNGKVVTGCYRNKDNEWYGDMIDGEYLDISSKVIAWQPLPKKYEPTDEKCGIDEGRVAAAVAMGFLK